MLKEMYLLASDWLLRQGEAEDMDEAERQRLNFHLRQFVDAMSPSLLLLSNPVALRRAMETGGASLADGARNLLHDLKEGRLTMVDAAAFAPGRNLALTPGKVVHRNRLIELIQYAPSTQTVHQIPLLILPPWINKYYILDMQPKNSMVRYLVDQGFTVFMVSWKNPDTSMDGTTIEDYMDLGPLEASEAIREITGSPTINVMGYCIGGTLLAMTLAWLAAKGDTRFGSATFMVSLQDFSKVGDTAVFLGEPAIDFVEQQMMERGYLDSREMSNMFNLLRSNDLIWSNVVNNYLLGQKPPAFDLLYWNSDGTRMTRAAHSWYLRNTYVENNLIEPEKIHLKGEALDLGRITLDAYAVGAEKDHIVPWAAAWRLTQLTNGKVRFVLASSGHIAGIINPPGGKGIYWVNAGDRPADTPEEWRASSTRHDGSWWTDWARWLAEHSGCEGNPPAMGSAVHPALDDAPGRNVLEK
jgi:polyhydroxyalkanoate synthase